MPQKFKCILYLIFGSQLFVSAQICQNFQYTGTDGNTYRGYVEFGLMAYHDNEARFHSWKYLLKPNKRITFDFSDCSSAEVRVRFQKLKLEQKLPDATITLNTDPKLIDMTGDGFVAPQILPADPSASKEYEFIFKTNPVATGYEGKLKGAIEFRLGILINGEAIQVFGPNKITIKYTLIPPQLISSSYPDLAIVTEDHSGATSPTKKEPEKGQVEESVVNEKDTIIKFPPGMLPPRIPDPIYISEHFEETSSIEHNEGKSGNQPVDSDNHHIRDPGHAGSETDSSLVDYKINPREELVFDHSEEPIEETKNGLELASSRPDSMFLTSSRVNKNPIRIGNSYISTIAMITIVLSGIVFLVYRELKRQ